MLINLRFLKKNVWKAIHNFEHKNRPDTLHYFTTDFFLSWPLSRSECTNFREFWPVLSDVPTHHFGERSAVKISTFFTLIISLFLCIF